MTASPFQQGAAALAACSAGFAGERRAIERWHRTYDPESREWYADISGAAEDEWQALYYRGIAIDGILGAFASGRLAQDVEIRIIRMDGPTLYRLACDMQARGIRTLADAARDIASA